MAPGETSHPVRDDAPHENGDSSKDYDPAGEEDETLDFLDLASAPLDDPDVFDRVVKDLLDGSIEVYFQPELQSVALGPEKKRREPQGESIPAAQILSWLHEDKGVNSIRELWVTDDACGGDSRIRAALWDASSGNALFSGIDIFSWLSPNISIRTVELVAPAVEKLTLVWDGCTRIVLDAWETDLKNGKLQELRVLIIIVSSHRHEDKSSELSMFKEAVAKQRDNIQIIHLDADDGAGNTNGTGNQSAAVVGRAEPTANDPGSGGPDWFQKMHAFNDSFLEAFDNSRGMAREAHHIKVAILDTGIDAGHEAFRACIYRRKSFIRDAHDFIDPDGHGTHVAGLVNRVAPNSKLLIGRIFDGSNYSQEQAAEGIRWATRQGAHIISCSWGFMKPKQELCDAVKDACQKGILIFASASNAGRSARGLPFPARANGVCAIGASNGYGERAEFSSPKAKFMLPGTAILSSFPRYLSPDSNAEKDLSGCSMACAIAAGTACRILEFATICSRNAEELKDSLDNEIIIETFERLAKDKYVIPWETRIPPDEENPAAWLRGRFLLSNFVTRYQR